MSSTPVQVNSMEQIAQVETAHPASSWIRQILAIFRLETQKFLWGRRALLMYALAVLPVFILVLMVSFPFTSARLTNSVIATEVFAWMFETLILRIMVFFGCAWIFMNLFRGDVVDRCLHYYFLCPVRREILVVGKYISGVVAAIGLFGTSTAVSLFLLYVPRGFTQGMDYLLNGPGFKQVVLYLGIVVFACVGYGAVFLLVGLIFRNPIFPAIAFLGWEMIGFLLPPILKKLSVLHYLKSLTPVPLSEGPFAIVAEPTPAWISIPGLLIMTALTLALASVLLRRMEIRYGGE
ncbi:MAG: ABC-2 transporter permease [Acidobacteria bacterium]|nr:ABC-2 transporter permease [Acidobacteriota bacterium]